MRLTRAMMLAASCLAAAAFGINASDGAFAQGAETQSKTCRVTRAKDVEIQRIEPFKVFDNLYYVGPCYVSVWLLTTPQGHILFDSAQEPFVDDVIENIEKTGTNLRDIKYIVLSHGHMDHVGGAERIRRVTGARVVAMAEDWTMMEGAPGQVEQPRHQAERAAQARHGGEGRRHAHARRPDAEVPSSPRPYAGRADDRRHQAQGRQPDLYGHRDGRRRLSRRASRKPSSRW